MRRGGGGGGGNNGRRGGSPRTQNFESNGPDIKVRGNAQQIVDKYQTLAREAATAGDPVMAENYYQHAEHYHRVLTASGGGENRQPNRQIDGDDPRSNYGAENGQRQPQNGQFTNGSDAAGSVKSPEAAAAPQGATTTADASGSPAAAAPPEAPDLADVSARVDGTAVPEAAGTGVTAVADEAAPVDAGVEKGRRPERKRGPRGPRPVKAADEPIAAAPGEAAPAPTISQPAAEDPEDIVKTVS